MFDFNLYVKKNNVTILVLIGFIMLLFLSFFEFSYNEKFILASKDKPNVIFLIFAIILFICFISKYLSPNKFFSIEHRQYSYVIDIDENHKIVIKQDNISSYNGGIDKAILLPANTSFDEKCITDKNSALGSYFLKNFPGKIDAAKNIIIDEATKKFFLSDKKKCADVGDTILLRKYDGEKTNILISAVTQDHPDIGIQANAVGIINSIKNALSICSENRYSSVTMPIIGTGHGGIEPKISLVLICIQYFLSVYHLQNHHVKELVIIVFDQNKRLKNDIYETVECIRKLILKKSKK
jgi:O-acetyl-ADP-ribose deacetylase (regulator of RNase III)